MVETSQENSYFFNKKVNKWSFEDINPDFDLNLVYDLNMSKNVSSN